MTLRHLVALMALTATAFADDLNPVALHRAPEHAPVVLVADGKPLGPIVVVGPQSATLKLLVKELRETIREATGVELPLAEALPATGPALVIGDCPEARAAGLDPAAMPAEGFAIKTAADRIFIVGSDANVSPAANDGTAWGVSEFMERFVGVRWYWPTAEGGRSVPKADGLSVPPVHLTDAPVYRMRTIWPPFDSLADGKRRDFRALYAVHRAASSWPVQLQCHTPYWEHNADYIANRPEVYLLRADGSRNPAQLCYSNPRTLATYLEEIEAQVSGKVERQGARNLVAIRGQAITVSPSDMGIACYCADCRALWDAEAGRYATASRIMGEFVRKLALAVKERWPAMTVVYLPYQNYTIAPTGIAFPDNVEVQLCGMPGLALYKEPAIAELFLANIARWQQLTGRKAQTWDYSCWPSDRIKALYQYPHVVRDYYQAQRQQLVGSFINGMDGDWVRQHITLYVWLKCLWNPDYDVDAAMDAFCQRLFGSAAGTMRELLQLQTERWEQVQWSTGRFSLKTVYTESFDKETVARMKALLDRARAEIGADPLLAQRLDFYAAPFAKFFAEAAAVHDGAGLRWLVARKVAENPKIDGKLDDAVWAEAEPQGMYRPGPDGEIPAAYPTEIRAVWTLDGISLGFRCTEPDPADLVRNIQARDDALAWHNDNVEIFLDVTGENNGFFYQWIVNPNATVWDGRHGNAAWNAEGAQIATHVGDGFWSVEMYLPYSLFPKMKRPGSGSEWIGQFTRHRLSSGADKAKRTKENHPEYSRMNYQFGGPSANTGDFGPIRFVE